MIVLGVSAFFHDSSACLIVDGQIIAAAAEERFSRIKHDNNFPSQAIDFCLKQAGLAINEVDAVAFYEKPILKFDRILHQHLANFPRSFPTFIKTTANWVNQKLNVKRILQEELNYWGDIRYVPHHLSHTASSYYLSGFDQAAIVNIDGVGEWATTSIGRAKGKKITLEKEIHFPHSLGLLYSAVTTYLGFRANNDEFKVMGLAAYGNAQQYAAEFNQLIQMHNDGSFSLNMKYFSFDWAERMYSSQLVELFGQPVRQHDQKLEKHHQDIAAGLQAKLEEIVLNLLNEVQQKYQLDNLCLGGGVALNSVLNGKILSETSFSNLYIAPDPSDAGGAMGAALWVVNQESNEISSRKLAKEFRPYLGPNYQWHQVKKTLDQYNLDYQYYKDRQELLNFTAEQIISKKIIGWFQGRMEWGPRALGNRSILASAVGPEMQDTLNAKVKHREMFRPFAPVILQEKVADFFRTDQPLPKIADYMLLVYPFQPELTADLPGVVHINKTGRLQSIKREDNSLYYDLIKTHERKTGLPIMINTSFNVRGEPIVCSPEDAVKCFLGTGIDILVIDNFVVEKKK